MSVKEQEPFLLRPCDRGPKTNGSFLEIYSTDKVPTHTILKNVYPAKFWKCGKRKNLFKEFKFAYKLYSAGKSVNDFDKIALNSPELWKSR